MLNLCLGNQLSSSHLHGYTLILGFKGMEGQRENGEGFERKLWKIGSNLEEGGDCKRSEAKISISDLIYFDILTS